MALICRRPDAPVLRGNNKLAFNLPGLGLQPVAESLGDVQHSTIFLTVGSCTIRETFDR
jgi:hypothetical protein